LVLLCCSLRVWLLLLFLLFLFLNYLLLLLWFLLLFLVLFLLFILSLSSWNEGLLLNVLHGALEALGLFGSEQLQAHLPLLFVLVRVLVLHLLQLRFLTARYWLWLVVLDGAAVGILITALFACLLLLLLLLSSFLLSGGGLLILFVHLLIDLGLSLILPCLHLSLILHLLHHQHLFLVFSDLDNGVRLVRLDLRRALL
jgi:hypothetical protein